MKRLVILFLVVAAAVALAGIYLPSDAAVVGSAAISRQALDSDLSAIAQSPDYTCFLSEERQLSGSSPVPMLGAGTPSARGGVYGTTFVDDWLGAMITDKVAARVAAREGLAITAADLAAAKTVLERRVTHVLSTYARGLGTSTLGCGGSAAAVLSGLPAWFVSQQTHAEAAQDLLDARAAGGGLTRGRLASYFRAHRQDFDRACISVIVVKSRASARKVEASLSAGTSFTHEAATASVTSRTGANGGAVGCGILAGTFLAPAVSSLRVGAVSAPVSGDGVFWIVRLTGRTVESLAQEQATVVTSMLSAGQATADAALTKALEATDLTIDPRYGSVSPGHVTLVLPPATPPATDVPSALADTPRLTAASA